MSTFRKVNGGVHPYVRGMYAAPADSTVLKLEIPNFQAILRYKQFLAIEIEILEDDGEKGYSELAHFDIKRMHKECNLSYRNIYLLVKKITQDGTHGELDADKITINLTKKGLENLLDILDAVREEFISESSF